MSYLKVLGFDPSLRNWGIAVGQIHLATGKLSISKVDVSQPVLQKGKQVRQNSQDIEAGYQHCKAIAPYLAEAEAIFVEVPVGSQSARSQASYGICVGILGAIQLSTPIYQLTPTEVKLATVGTKTATKKEMIEYAVSNFPEAGWPMKTVNGSKTIVEGKAEHMADAVATIVAGLELPEFQQALKFRAA